MMFDTEVSVLTTTLSVPSAEAMEGGADPVIEFAVITGLALPIPNPQTGQPLVLPAGKIRFTFARDQAIEVFEGALEEAKKLPEKFRPSGNIVVASDLSAVEKAAEDIKRVTGQ